MANHIRVFTAIIFSQLVVFYFGLQMDVSLSELILTVVVASLVEIIYHVKLVRKIGANISFETFWKNCDQLFRKNAVLFLFFSFLPHHFQRWGFRVLYYLASFLCRLGYYYHFSVK